MSSGLAPEGRGEAEARGEKGVREAPPWPVELGAGSILRAYLKVLLAGVLWAASGPLSTALHRGGVPPSGVALLRTTLGAVFLLLLFRLAPRARTRADGVSVLVLFLGGGAIVALNQFAFQMSTSAVGVPATVALLYLAPAIVLAASVPLFRERLTPGKALLGALSVLGVWLTVAGTRGTGLLLTPTGVLWGATCGTTYAAFTLLGRGYGRRVGALVALLWSTMGGAALLILIWVLQREPVVLPGDWRGWTALILLGGLTVGAAPFLFFDAMRRIEAGRAAIATTVEPLAATLLAVAFLDQRLTPLGWVGLGLLLGGVSGAYSLPNPPVTPPAADALPPRPRPPPGSGG
jgi:drug/metabolite transporter, DME family